MLTSITEQLCDCTNKPECQWKGRVHECLPDIDGDGGLGCPLCNSIILVLPPKDKRVLAYLDDKNAYPFIGYFDGEKWLMETGILNYDGNQNDIFGNVVSWQEIPKQNSLEDLGTLAFAFSIIAQDNPEYAHFLKR